MEDNIGTNDQEVSPVRTNDQDSQRAQKLTGANMNLLPLTRTYAESQTWYFYEPFIHVLEGVPSYDFSPDGIDKATPEEWIRINWAEIQYVIQMVRGETPEDIIEYEANENETSPTETELEELAIRNKQIMRNCRKYVVRRFGHSFGIPDPEELPWDKFEGLD